MSSNKGIEHWKSKPAGPGSGVVALVRGTGKVVYSGRLDKGPHAGKWIRIVNDEADCIIEDSDKETRAVMEARYGGPQSSDLER
jgi:hypothetical protein